MYSLTGGRGLPKIVLEQKKRLIWSGHFIFPTKEVKFILGCGRIEMFDFSQTILHAARAWYDGLL
jgi:hypothetical protein